MTLCQYDGYRLGVGCLEYRVMEGALRDDLGSMKKEQVELDV